VRAYDPVVAQHDVEQQLAVQPPVARVVEDHDGVDLEALGRGVGSVEVDGPWQGPRERRVVGAEVAAEGPDIWIGGVDIAWRHDVLEPVLLGDEAAGIAVAAADEDGFVAVAGGAVGSGEFGERRVRLDQLGDVDVAGGREGEFSVEVFCALGFGLAAAVGEEDEGDVVFAEIGETLRGAGDGGRGAQQDAVYVEGEGEVGYPRVGGLGGEVARADAVAAGHGHGGSVQAIADMSCCSAGQISSHDGHSLPHL